MFCRPAARSEPPLPVQRIAAAMKTRDDEEGVAVNTKKQHIRKLVDPSPAQRLEYEGKLQRFGDHPLNSTINLYAKTTTQPGGFAFTYQSCA
jgi:hypothetical protein